MTTPSDSTYALKSSRISLSLLPDDHLLPVGTAAQEYNVKILKIYFIPRAKLFYFRPDPSPLTAFLQALDISPVSVKIQKIRIKMANGNVHFCSPSSFFRMLWVL